MMNLKITLQFKSRAIFLVQLWITTYDNKNILIKIEFQ